MDQTQLAVFILTFLVMLVGLAATVLPVLPGLPLMWVGALLYGWLGGWGEWGGWIFVVMTVLTVVGYTASQVLTHVGAAKKGASWQGLLAALVLGTIGFFVIPIVGALIGAVAGLFLVENHRRKDANAAWAVTKGALIGYGLGVGIEIMCGVGMFVLWGIWVWTG